MAPSGWFSRAPAALLGLFFSLLPPRAPAAAEARGFWVECEGSNSTLSTRAKIDELVRHARRANVNLLYVQVYRHDRAWFDSRLADASPYREIVAGQKIDPLRYLIEQAGAAGIEVHAWMNMFRIGKDRSAPALRQLGAGAAMRDGSGKSLLDYKPADLPDGGIWLDPGDPQVARYLLGVIRELVEKYPGIRGVHLDYIRYPHKVPEAGSFWAKRADYGYGLESVRRFREWTGLDPLTMELSRENCQAWDNWRRYQVNSFVESAGSLLRTLDPALTLSVAVVGWADRAYLSSFQDWRRWLEEGLVDVAAVMNYSTDSRVARYVTRAAAQAALGRRQVYVGLGEYLLGSRRQELFRQLDDARAAGAAGIVFFSYDSMLKNPSIFELLGRSRFTPPVPVPAMPWKKPAPRRGR